MPDFIIRYKIQGQCNRCGQCCIGEDCDEFEINNNIATCKIYDLPDRPLKCVLFPELPPIPREFEKCGYYFLDTWEDDRVVKHKVS